MPRGRAASVVRPGFIIKAVLSGKQPLISPSGGTTGELVEEACATDVHLTYQALLHAENELRPRAQHLHGMTTDSFCKLFRFARLMGLIEFVRNEPMIYPPVGASFYRVEMYETKAGVRRPKAVISDRKIHKITEKGKVEDKAWGDLCKAWREHWEVGIIHEPITPPEAIPTPTIEKRRPGRPRKEVAPFAPVEGTAIIIPEVPVVVKWTPIKLAETPSMKQFKKLYNQLVKLSKIGVQDPDVMTELTVNVNSYLGDWEADLEVRLTMQPAVMADPELVKRLTAWWDAIKKVSASINLEDENGNPTPKFQPAIAALAAIIE